MDGWMDGQDGTDGAFSGAGWLFGFGCIEHFHVGVVEAAPR